MKKTLYSALCAATLLTLAGCSAEDPMSVPGADGTVTFSVSMPTIPGTRAENILGDGKRAGKLSYYVYDVTDGTPELVYQTTTNAMFNTNEATHIRTVKLSLGLATGREYEVMWWCYNKNREEHFVVDTENRTVKIDYEGLNSSEDIGDAFYAFTEKFKVTGAMTHDVTMTRPFAWLNFGTSDMEMSAANSSLKTAYGEDFGNLVAKVTVKGAPDVLDFRTGEVSYSSPEVENGEIVFGYNKPTTNTYPTISGSTKTYKYLATGLVLAGRSGVVDVTLTVGNGTTDITEVNSPSTPVRANYRTNLFGEFLTSKNSFNVSVVPGFADALETEVLGVISNGGDATLSQDLVLSSHVDFAKDTDIDLNGKSLTLVGSHTLVSEGASVVLENGKIIVENNAVAPDFKVESGSTLILKNVEIVSAGAGIQAQDDCAKLEMENVKYSSEYYCVTSNASNAKEDDKGAVIVLKNCTLAAESIALMLNVPVELTCENCTFNSGIQGAFMRGGVTTFKDCTFNAENNMDNYHSWGKDPQNPFRLYVWSQGNYVTSAGLVVGNYKSTSYNYPTTVTLEGKTTINVTGTSADHTPGIHVCAANGKLVTFNYNPNDVTINYPAGTVLYEGSENIPAYKTIEFGTTGICVNGVTITDDNKATFPGYIGE